MARDIGKVIDAVLRQIPPDTADGLIRELQAMKDAISVSPPESHEAFWVDLSNRMESMIPVPPDTEWERRIISIVRGNVL